MEAFRLQKPLRHRQSGRHFQKCADKGAALAPLHTVNDGLEEMREAAEFRWLTGRLGAIGGNPAETLSFLSAARSLLAATAANGLRILPTISSSTALHSPITAGDHSS